MRIKEYLRKVEKGEILPSKEIPRIVEKLDKLNEKYSCFITLNKNPRITSKKGRLRGIPVVIKDCICTKGLRTTSGSKILENYFPVFNATIVKKIEEEGGIIVGKTSMDEFGFGTFCTNCAFNLPKNPHDITRSAGGSSGGAAVALAMSDLPLLSIAESTGGSISCPASFCGVYGLTPTYGLVSRYGLIDYSNSLDKIGVMGKSAWDCALGLSVIAGRDSNDQTSIGEEKDYTRFVNKKYIEKNISGKIIGVPKEYFGKGVDKQVKKIVMNAIKKYESLGVKIKEISLPYTKYALSAYYVIALAESSTNLSKFCGLRYGLATEIKGNADEYFSSVRTKGFGKEAKRRILLGTYIRMKGYRNKYYLKALKVRKLIIEDFKKAFEKCDVLMAPTMPFIAPKFNEIKLLTPAQQYASDILTVAPNLAGLPMINVPVGKINGMPVGLHIIGNHFEEGEILSFAGAIKW